MSASVSENGSAENAANAVNADENAENAGNAEPTRTVEWRAPNN
jgi:hypothetical protein